MVTYWQLFFVKNDLKAPAVNSMLNIVQYKKGVDYYAEYQADF